MQIAKTVLRNLTLLNIILMAAIAIFVNYSPLPMFNREVKYTLPAAKKNMEMKKETLSQTQATSIEDYTIIAEQNLFHPSRTIVAAKDAKSETKPEFVLYGTLITDDISLAYLEDLKAPYSTQGRGKRQRALSTGATLSGYTLSEIYHDRVVMVRGEEKIILNVAASRKGPTETPSAVSVQKPTAAPISFQEKPSGAGRPPGIIMRDAPSEQAPEMLPKARDAIEAIIKEKLGPLSETPRAGHQ